MPDIDPTLTGRYVQALPIDTMVAAPIMGAVKAQVRASKMYIDFLRSTCFDKDGKAVEVVFEKEELVTDGQGNLKNTQMKIIKVPLLAIIEHPNFIVKSANVKFEMEVSQSMESKSSTAAEGGFKAKLGWGPFSVSVHGKVSHKSEQTRKTDTRSKYSFDVTAEHAGAPEALHRIIETLTNTDPVNKGEPQVKTADQITSDDPPPDATTPPAGP